MCFTFLPNNYSSHRVCCTIRFILTPPALTVASTWYVCLRCPGTFCTRLYELFYTMSERYCSNVILGADCISESLGSWYSNLRSLAGGSAHSTPQWTVYKVCRGYSLPISCFNVISSFKIKLRLAYLLTFECIYSMPMLNAPWLTCSTCCLAFLMNQKERENYT